MELIEGSICIHGESILVFCRGWFLREQGEVLSSGVEQLVDHVKANISGDGGDVRRKRELGTIDGTNRSIVDMKLLFVSCTRW